MCKLDLGFKLVADFESPLIAVVNVVNELTVFDRHCSLYRTLRLMGCRLAAGQWFIKCYYGQIVT